MKGQEPEIYAATAKRILKKTEKRVSETAAEELRETIDNYGEKLSRKAAEMAEHAGRETIRKEDIKIAQDNI